MRVRRTSTLAGYAAIVFTSVTILGACDPALYKQPAEDFQTASATLRDAYFLEWEMSNRARIERGDLEDQVQIWTSPVGVPVDELKRVSMRMAERRQEDIHGQLRPLREQAFAAIGGYASTLVSLSSDEPTERIQSELTGLVDDINGTLEAADKLKFVDDAANKLAGFTGPLKQYVGVLNEIIGLVSDVVREQAIIDTIGKSNDSIIELLNILKEEAAAAQNNALNQTKSAKKNIDNFMTHEKFKHASNDTRAAISRRRAELETVEQQLASLDIDAVFEAAVRAQGALVVKAMLSEPGDWTIRIKRFKEQVAATKAKIEKINSQM